eukprot:CAMPEP_0113970144 /NCGR_PEP_ID=MMETSP0011_2-20120614/10916_1 /TAXON_ID=101924 /ORGANISM="Rhodosorus marinus" /LENGTH=41 /DNA_ID=CAMNT_0000984293 /DNA_START=613 /DNA_END=738 /DNA_ORIENTATION=- /assembly_acc=CAM_ASM_000156
MAACPVAALLKWVESGEKKSLDPTRFTLLRRASKRAKLASL